MGKTIKVILAYVAGQATQLVIHAMVLNNNMYSYRQVPFCAAGGFVILFAVIAGVWLASKDESADAKHKKKSYLDYADAPESDKEMVVNLFGKKNEK